MAKMHNPPHPGEVLRAYLGTVSVTDAADAMKVARVTLSRVLNGNAGISPDMAYRVAAVTGTSAEMWASMQMQYDLYHAGQVKRPALEKLAA